jgi:hypothetical protein
MLFQEATTSSGGASLIGTEKHPLTLALSPLRKERELKLNQAVWDLGYTPCCFVKRHYCASTMGHIFLRHANSVPLQINRI